jgi:Fanconi-associated nuclease 1
MNDICELITLCWSKNYGFECSLVSWNLFESLEELLSLVKCFTNVQLTSLCRFMSQNLRYCRSGGPDLVVWTTKSNKCVFVEVKGPGDKLSYKQMLWLDFLIKNSIDCEVCHVKGQNSKRLRTNSD